MTIWTQPCVLPTKNPGFVTVHFVFTIKVASRVKHFVYFFGNFFRFYFINIDIFNRWLKPKDSSKIQIKSIYSVRINGIAIRVFRNPIRSNLTESTVVLGIKPSTPIGKIAATIGLRKRYTTLNSVGKLFFWSAVTIFVFLKTVNTISRKFNVDYEYAKKSSENRNFRNT